jgi:hypothetical protein
MKDWGAAMTTAAMTDSWNPGTKRNKSAESSIDFTFTKQPEVAISYIFSPQL